MMPANNGRATPRRRSFLEKDTILIEVSRTPGHDGRPRLAVLRLGEYSCTRRVLWGRMVSCAPVWKPAPGGHLETSAGGLPTRRRLPTCPTSRHFPSLYFASLSRK